MALKKQVFLDTDAGTELVMPCYAPTGYGWNHELEVETVHLDQLGDLAIPTTKKPGDQTLELLFPAQKYPFCVPEAETDPWYYVEQLERLCDQKRALRYIVTGTPLNAQVKICSVEYAEDDGTGDVTCRVGIREYRTPETSTEETTDAQVGADRIAAAAPETGQYTVAAGDTLWGIARQFYGDGSLCWRLAAANGIANANLLTVGQVISLPALDALPAQATTQPKSARVIQATQETTQETGESSGKVYLSTRAEELAKYTETRQFLSTRAEEYAKSPLT